MLAGGNVCIDFVCFWYVLIICIYAYVTFINKDYYYWRHVSSLLIVVAWNLWPPPRHYFELNLLNSYIYSIRLLLLLLDYYYYYLLRFVNKHLNIPMLTTKHSNADLETFACTLKWQYWIFVFDCTGETFACHFRPSSIRWIILLQYIQRL